MNQTGPQATGDGEAALSQTAQPESEQPEQPDPLRSWQWLARRQRAALRWWVARTELRRFLNLLVPGLLAAGMLFAAIPGSKLPERLRSRHDDLSSVLRTISISERWMMYAPNPTRGHAYLEFIAHDHDGGVRVLEESRLVEEGWGSTWAWTQTRRNIWLYTVGRQHDKVNRNRTWFMRGLCVREARRGHAVDRIEVNRVYRGFRSPEQLRAGAETLGPIKRRKVQDGSCHVAIIREMIATDPPAGADGHD